MGVECWGILSDLLSDDLIINQRCWKAKIFPFPTHFILTVHYLQHQMAEQQGKQFSEQIRGFCCMWTVCPSGVGTFLLSTFVLFF